MAQPEPQVLELGKQPFEVHLTNSGPAILELLGPAAIVLAALVGAWFAARYARQNVRQELAAAEDRLKIQMDHERRNRDREAARSAIDDIVKTIDEIMDKDAEFHVEIGRAEALRTRVEETPENSLERKAAEEKLLRATEDLEQSRSEAADALVRAHPARFRLRLRFAEDHPIVTSFSAWQATMDRIYSSSRKGMLENRSAEEVMEAEELVDEVDPAVDEFAAVVRDWMNAVPAEAPNQL